MNKYLSLIEVVSAQNASLAHLYGDAGTSTRVVNESNPEYQRNFLNTIEMLEAWRAGKISGRQIAEAMSPSDFPLYFGAVLDRQLLGYYNTAPKVWPSVAKRSLVPDFRNVERYDIAGGRGQLDGPIDVGGPYTAKSLSESKYAYRVYKYGDRMPFYWETLINDDLNAFTDIPQRFGLSAQRTEDKLFTTLHFDANGPHASIYTAGNGNVVTSNPVLSIEALQTAYTIFASMVDSDGEPIIVDGAVLEVPPALAITAQNILNALELRITNAGGTSNEMLVTTNWMKGKVELVVNPYIPIVASSANGNTSWALHAKPVAGRAFIEMGFLRGHETPEIFVKEPDQRKVGGGINPLDGSFENDSLDYKIRHCMGGSVIDVNLSVASNGSSS